MDSTTDADHLGASERLSEPLQLSGTGHLNRAHLSQFGQLPQVPSSRFFMCISVYRCKSEVEGVRPMPVRVPAQWTPVNRGMDGAIGPDTVKRLVD